MRGLCREWDQARYVANELHVSGLEEEGDEAEDERVEGDRLGLREAEPADALKLVFHLRLAGDRLDLLTEDEADADTGADRAEPSADAEGDRLTGGFDCFVGHLGNRKGHEIHRV